MEQEDLVCSGRSYGRAVGKAEGPRAMAERGDGPESAAAHGLQLGCQADRSELRCGVAGGPQLG